MLNVRTCDPTKIKVLLLKGGTSNERAVSLDSGAAVAVALRAEGFSVTEIDTGEKDAISRISSADCDVVFIALHGKGGEDGTVQGLCELIGKPYVGSGVLASALAMDKARSKTFYSASGLPTPNSITIEKGHDYVIEDIIAAAGEKCVVKPACDGSAIGVSIVHNHVELQQAIDMAFEVGNKVLVERYVEGMEVTVAVLGNDDPIALPVIEIVPCNEFYDYEAKYQPGGSEHICPARISEDLAKTCQRISVEAHKALGCRGVSRSDIIIDASSTCWILETNTIPGMTSTSLLPDAARVMGIGFPQLCRLMVELALEE